MRWGLRGPYWAGVLLVALLAATATAQNRDPAVEAMRSEKRVALVIGNARYEPPASLRNPVNVATDMAHALRGFGFDVVFYTDADLKQMQRAVREFTAKLVPGGVGLFYYAGHGIQVRGSNYCSRWGRGSARRARLRTRGST